ncbi:hypothetical protein SAMN05444161_3635 [Rhizobiales bacterium GAS191]|nr:hypothetical protein SAMN05444161_3635 [Rhizobiales bacterium GAS191]
MKPWRAALLLLALMAAGSLPARAECQFSPFSFFPDRNDAVEIRVRTESGHSCAMAFKEGPGYRFTKASFQKPPPHGVLARTGPTKFLYLPFKGYRGEDSYAIKLCAIVQGRSGCSSLTYLVDVQ